MKNLLVSPRRWLLALLASALAAAGACAEEAVPESAVRAALLFNFLKFTDWPAATDASRLQVCVAASDPEQLAAIEALGGRQARGRTLSVVRHAPQASCDVIYVDARRNWNAIMERGAPRALTVGGYAGFVADAGMIEIVLQEGRARFDVNLGEARRAGLRLSPQMLQLARRIVE